MPRIKSIDDCRSGDDLERLALKEERKGNCTVTSGGSHRKIKTPKGSMPIARGEWGKGLRRAICKQWRLLFAIALFVWATDKIGLLPYLLPI